MSFLQCTTTNQKDKLNSFIDYFTTVWKLAPRKSATTICHNRALGSVLLYPAGNHKRELKVSFTGTTPNNTHGHYGGSIKKLSELSCLRSWRYTISGGLTTDGKGLHRHRVWCRMEDSQVDPGQKVWAQMPGYIPGDCDYSTSVKVVKTRAKVQIVCLEDPLVWNWKRLALVHDE